MSKHYTLPDDLFGRKCKIQEIRYGTEKETVYRIINSEILSDTWADVPVSCCNENVHHDHMENVLIVTREGLEIDERSKLIRVALKDVELIPSEETCDDTVSRQEVLHQTSALIDEFEKILREIMELNTDESVCGLCEHDGSFYECPGCERDNCFSLKDKYREEWFDMIKVIPSARPS
jgi:hypothetical protein